MNIYNTQISFGKEVPENVSFNIYFSGCKDNKLCDREFCHNQDLHNFKKGKDSSKWIKTIEDTINNKLINCICLLGGEPFDQSYNEFLDFVIWLKKFNKPLYAYSGYYYKELQESLTVFFDDIYCGPFKVNENLQSWAKKTIK